MKGVAVRRRARAHHRAGFTLIELMVSLVISSLLVAMILSIFTRMSTAFRTQQHIAELQQVLTSAQDLIQRDVRQAGFHLPDGFRIKGTPGVHSAVELRDNPDGFGPDELHVFYADSSAQARVLTFNSLVTSDSFTSFTVDDPDRFDSDDVVVLSNYKLDVAGATGAITVARYEACVVQLQQISGTTFAVRPSGDWGESTNDQCDLVRAAHADPSLTTMPINTMVYRFKARGYRVDPTRRSMAVLQLSASGGLVANDWQDLGVGFTDLQLASRWHEDEDTRTGSTLRLDDTADVDSDPIRDWYSGPDMATLTAVDPTAAKNRPLLMELRVSLAVRTTRRLDTVGSGQTPAFTDVSRPNNNDVGNRPAVTLAGVPDGSRPEELRGDHLYRYSTVGSDTRNLAVGR